MKRHQRSSDSKKHLPRRITFPESCTASTADNSCYNFFFKTRYMTKLRPQGALEQWKKWILCTHCTGRTTKCSGGPSHMRPIWEHDHVLDRKDQGHNHVTKRRLNVTFFSPRQVFWFSFVNSSILQSHQKVNGKNAKPSPALDVGPHCMPMLRIMPTRTNPLHQHDCYISASRACQQTHTTLGHPKQNEKAL